jgi:hypothetical protein
LEHDETGCDLFSACDLEESLLLVQCCGGVA